MAKVQAGKALWTADEDATLRRLHARGDTFKEIAAEIGARTPNACLSRAGKLGLYSRDRGEQISKGRQAQAYRNLALMAERRTRTNGDVDASTGSRD